MIEIRGEVKEYDDQAEIILESNKQLGGGIVRLPPLPKNFDVEQRGHFSAGQFRAPHSHSTRKRKGARLCQPIFWRTLSRTEQSKEDTARAGLNRGVLRIRRRQSRLSNWSAGFSPAFAPAMVSIVKKFHRSPSPNLFPKPNPSVTRSADKMFRAIPPRRSTK